MIEVKNADSLIGVQDFAAQRGVWLRAFGRYLYTMPPYIITGDELRQITGVMKAWFSDKD